MSGGSRPRSPEAELVRLLSSLRQDAAELSALLDAGPALSEAWRESFARDAVDFTIDRIENDEASWFAWWAYLLEHGDRPTCAIVSNLDALAGIEQAAPGHLDGLVQRLAGGALSLSLIVPPEARRGPAAALMSMLHTSGVDIRVGDVSGWFAVTPGRAALVPADWGRDRDVDALVLHLPSMVAALEQLFETRWSAAEPWHDELLPPDPVIELLCGGMTDAQIAERLGISVRSVRRRVAARLEREGASTRMELGFRLGRQLRGVLSRDGS